MASLPRPNANSPPEKQLSLDLAIRHAPIIVRQHGLQEVHTFPLVSRGRPFWATKRVPTKSAFRGWQEIELHSATAKTVIVLDVDRPAQEYLDTALSGQMPLPNWIAGSPISDHAHVIYTLSRPVIETDQARQKPIWLLGRLVEFLRQGFNADAGYTAQLQHSCHKVPNSPPP